MQIERSDDWMTLTVHMEAFIINATEKWLPDLPKTGKLPEGVPQGAALRKALDELRLLDGEGRLDEEQQEFQRVVGAIRWMIRRLVRLMRAAHMLSCVAARCSRVVDGHPCGGLNTALGVLAEGYAARREGHTYSEHTGPIQFIGVVKDNVSIGEGGKVACRT